MNNTKYIVMDIETCPIKIDDEYVEYIIKEKQKAIELYENEKKEYLKLFRKLKKKNQTIKDLTGISGIDVILSVTIFSVVIDAKRFPDKYKYWSYCGLIKYKRESGGKLYGKKNTNYSRVLKTSYKIAENKDNIAILELNPLSKGHTLVVPKKHLDKISESTRELAEAVSKKLQEKFSLKEVKVNELEIMGHAILEVIPIYGDERQREKATKEELEFVQKEILKVEEIKIEEKFKEDNGSEEIAYVLPVRIP